MNLPAKSPTSSRSTRTDDSEELAKWHCVLNLFADATGEDRFLAKNIKDAIDAALDEEDGLDASLANFAEAAFRLVANHNGIQTSYGLFHLDLRGRNFDPLFVRSELLVGLKRIAGYDSALIFITGLRGAIQGNSQRFNRKQRENCDRAKAYIDSLAAEWTTGNTALTILYT